MVRHVEPVCVSIGLRADEADLLAIPRGDDDRMPGAPAALPQIAQAAADFEQGREAGAVIADAVDPGVAMGTDDHAVVVA
jgi:hypothetical protein